MNMGASGEPLTGVDPAMLQSECTTLAGLTPAAAHQSWVSEYEAHENDSFPKGKQMGRYSQETGSTFKQPPADTHAARCYRLIDLGTQRGTYQGEPTVRNQVMVSWELPDCLMDDGRPFVVSAFLTNSLNEKAKLRAWLESWRGKHFTADELKKFDLQNVLGAPCLVTVIHNEKGKAQVTNVTKVPKGMDIPKAVNPPSTFWLDSFDIKAFDALPDGIKNIIQESDEYKAMHKGGSDPARHFDDLETGLPAEEEVPF